MTFLVTARPQSNEHAPFYGQYVSRVPDGDLLALLNEQCSATTALIRRVPAERADFSYAPGKWTIKEVVAHLIDVERVMTFRALWFARGDPTALPGFDENAWATQTGAAGRTLPDLADEFEAVRSSTIHFASHLSPEMLERRGTSSGQPLSVRALLYIVAGHERHHAELFRERYGLR